VAKRHLLLVDADSNSLRVMEVSLRRAGFAVTTAVDGLDALGKVKTCSPDLVISDVEMPKLDGLELCKRLREDEATCALPFLFLTPQKSVEHKRKGLELGVEDFLSKPIFVHEIVTRVRLLLSKRERERLEREGIEGRTFSGDLRDLGAVDLVRIFERGRKTGAIHLIVAGHGARICFSEGALVDAEFGKLAGAPAFYRLLCATDGRFEVDFAPFEGPGTIAQSNQGLLTEGLRRLDEWGRLLEQLPPLSAALEVDGNRLTERIAEIPDEANGLLRLIDGARTLEQIIDESTFDALAALELLSQLYAEGLIREAGGAGHPEPPAPAMRAASAAVAEQAAVQSAAPPPTGCAPRTQPAKVHFFQAPLRTTPPPRGNRESRAPVAPLAPSADGWFFEPATTKAPAAPPAAAAAPERGAQPTSADPFVGRAGSNSPGALPAVPGRAFEPTSSPEPARLPPAQAPNPALAPAVLLGGAAAEPSQTEAEPPTEVGDSDFEPAPQPLQPQTEALEPEGSPPRRSPSLAALAVVALLLLGGAVVYQRLQQRGTPPAGALPAPPRAAQPPPPAPELRADGPALVSPSAPPTGALAQAPAAHADAPKPPPTGDIQGGEKAASAAQARGPREPKKAGAETDYARLIATGYERFKANRVSAAAADFSRALALRPNGSEALIGLGIALVDKDPAKAASYLERGLALNPRDARAQVTLGAAYQTLNRNADAVRAYKVYLSLAPHGEYADEVRTILENLR
jgi:CheY-like chemotaxis protein/tetratricopeptide (TPR) repeat protein